MLAQLFKNAQRFRRNTVKAKDVILPFLVLTSMDFVLLIAMTVVAPVVWKRQPTDSRDQYERVLATYGSCQASNEKTNWFLGSLFALNFLAILLSNVQIFLARNLPRNLNETNEVAFSMLMLLEACLVGLPVFLVVQESPTALFLVATALIVVVCLAIMIPQIPRKVKQQRHLSVRGSTDATRGSVLRAIGFSKFSSGAPSLNASMNSIRSSLKNYVHQPNAILPEAVDAPPGDEEGSLASFQFE